MADLLALADDETRALWDGLQLGYTESTGHPLLRREIASLYDTIDADEVLTFAGAEEAIFCLMNVLVGPGDHVIVTWPGYQSLYEVARAAGADVTLHELREAHGWAIDVDAAAPPGHARDPADRGQPAAQPDRHAGRPRRRSTRSLPSPPRPAPTCSSTRSTAASSSTRPTGCRPAPTPCRAASRSASCPSRSPWPGCGSAGWRRTTGTCSARVAAFKDYTTICSSAPVGGPGAHRPAGARPGARPVARDRGREPRAARRVLRRLGRPVHLGPPAGRLDRLSRG